MLKDEAMAKEGAAQTEKEDLTSSKTKSTNITYTELPAKDETSETIVRDIYCLFPYIYDSLGNCKRDSFFAKSLNKPSMEDYIQGLLYEVKIVFTVSSFCGFFSLYFLIVIKMERSTKYALLDKIITLFQTRSIKSSKKK